MKTGTEIGVVTLWLAWPLPVGTDGPGPAQRDLPGVPHPQTILEEDSEAPRPEQSPRGPRMPDPGVCTSSQRWWVTSVKEGRCHKAPPGITERAPLGLVKKKKNYKDV